LVYDAEVNRVQKVAFASWFRYAWAEGNRPMTVTELPLQLDMEKIATFCKKWHIARLEIFGSVLRDDFKSDSDLDFLYTAGARFRRELAYGPWAQNRIAEELSRLMGREVDLIERRQIEKHRNWIRREHILNTALPVYVEG
jgi:predicted nucleotidyltransferase